MKQKKNRLKPATTAMHEKRMYNKMKNMAKQRANTKQLNLKHTQKKII